MFLEIYKHLQQKEAQNIELIRESNHLMLRSTYLDYQLLISYKETDSCGNYFVNLEKKLDLAEITSFHFLSSNWTKQCETEADVIKFIRSRLNNQSSS